MLVLLFDAPQSPLYMPPSTKIVWPGYKRSALRGQPYDRVGHFFRSAEAAEWDLIDPGSLNIRFRLPVAAARLRGQRFQAVGRGIARGNIVCGDAIFAEFICQASHQPHHSRANRIRKNELRLRLTDGHRTDGDDATPAPLLHVRDNSARESHCAAQIQSERIVPFRASVVSRNSLAGGPACVRDANVDAVKYAMNVLYKSFNGEIVADVEGFGVRLNSEAMPNFGCHSLQSLEFRAQSAT